MCCTLPHGSGVASSGKAAPLHAERERNRERERARKRESESERESERERERKRERQRERERERERERDHVDTNTERETFIDAQRERSSLIQGFLAQKKKNISLDPTVGP